ncbi:pyridoxal phosphate enzyme, YggS family [Filifactor alocis ATCC 35896]|uniref:Pyridoxal phosphate homeostasis protein n=1 Tax=Filifactor alocis (strain ATCC 35896 / CCUG 47790 / D40 B5) TaxID=546269 RepID=D6GQU3_FILAD|nr:YggS family pyridoxal phosphate-dependent enzyme [Filifactor alocis]EFE29146.1 pyridoxal phosphate enzyme, YggS family [Filifactor alocis ATCC 35896]
MDVKDNLKSVQASIEQARQNSCEKQEVTLVAVTKTIDVGPMKEVLKEGVSCFGENKVQEILSKYEKFPDTVKWHLIGTLQSNKVKYIIDKVEMIHSLDRISLAKEIDRRAKEIGVVMKCLIQVNISQEESKHGLDKAEALKFIEEVAQNFSHIQVLGLMGMAPFVEDAEEARPYFRQLKGLFEEAKNLNLGTGQMKYLSMGMTNDYTVAIEEGSNMVRVGTGIFGKRNYN